MSIVAVDCMEALRRFYGEETAERKALFLVTADAEGRANMMPFTSWAIECTESRGWELAVYVFVKAHTHALIEQTGQFVVSVPREGMEDVEEYCGNRSGRDSDKLRECGLTTAEASLVEAPLIRECIAHVECEVYNAYRFWMTYPGTDRQSQRMTVFQGRILAAHVRED